MGSHQSSRMINDEWLTPFDLIKKLGDFDLDPCSPIQRPWDTAKNHYSKLENGLLKPWYGRVWCNPPYGKYAHYWLSKCASHGNAMALIFARTETKMFFDAVWAKAKAILFIKDRLYFYDVNGNKAKANSGAPSVLIAYDEYNSEILKKCKIPGYYTDIKKENLLWKK